MILFSNCKINIGLNILRKRADGFHDLDTIMLPMRDLCDIVEINKSTDMGISFSSSGLVVDCPEDKNLCIKAYRLMEQRYGIGGVKLHLHKNIPFGAGLGGGSANAAYTIKGLNNLFKLGLSDSEMESLAAELGSDTAIFIRNRAMVASGRGELLEPIDLPLSDYYLLLVKPNIGVSTAEAFAGVAPCSIRAQLKDLISEPVDQWRDLITNQFEQTLFQSKPQLAQIKQSLYDHGAVYASMSGSGSTIYGIFSSKPDTIPWSNDHFTHCEKIG